MPRVPKAVALSYTVLFLRRSTCTVTHYFADFGYIHPLQRYLQSKSGVVRNCTKFLHLLCPEIFWEEGGEGPKFWDLDYKIERTSDHVAKFHINRPRELGDLAVKKGKEKKEKKRNISSET